MKKEIEIPEGKILVKVDEETYKVIDENRVLPKTWEEYCETHPDKNGWWFIDLMSNVCEIAPSKMTRDTLSDRNILSSKEQAEAFLALMQLVQLRDCYNEYDDFPTDKKYRFAIVRQEDKIVIDRNETSSMQRVLVFRNEDLAHFFLANFRDLIETAKELI